MTMAGDGSRFKKLYPNIPKPLINVNNNPMFLNSLKSILNVFGSEHDYYFVIQDNSFLEYRLHCLCEDVVFLVCKVETITSGQAETATIPFNFIHNNEPIVIFNCDTCFEGINLKNYCYKYDGCISYFDTEEKDKWSFISINEYNMVTSIKEKVPISNHATSGLYIFKNKEIYTKYYEKILHYNTERYISLVYAEMIKDNLEIKALPTDVVGCYGTPEQLEEYNKGFRYHTKES